MTRLHTLIVKHLCLFVLSLILISPAMAEITVVNKDDCPQQNRLFETYRTLNSHTAVFDNVYEKVFCYQEKYHDDEGKTALIFGSNDDEQLRECWGENTLLFTTSSRNAHVAMPHDGFVNKSVYVQDLCYGYLQCSPNGTNAGEHSQKLAALNDLRNAHISEPKTTDSEFATDVYCWEPICDQNTYEKQIPFPYLYTFDADKEHFETSNLANFAGVETERLAEPLSDEALIIELTPAQMKYNLSPIRIQNWSGYAELEFFVYYESTAFNSGLEIYDPDAAFKELLVTFSNATKNYDELYVWKYATTTPKPESWLKIRIPVEKLGFVDVSTIEFKIENSNFEQTLWVDSMTFISKLNLDSSMKKFETFYCDMSDNGAEYTWESDADSEEIMCDNIIGFDGTGAGCCGDDSKEFFSGPVAGCFDSTKIPNGTVFNRTQNPQISSSQICMGGNCPGSKTVINVTTGESYISGLHYGFENNTFYMCGSGSDAARKKTTNQGVDETEPLWSDKTNYSRAGQKNDGDACVIVGDYFCSPDGYFSNRTDDVVGFDLYDDPDDNSTIRNYTERNRSFTASVRDTIKADFADVTGVSCCPEKHCFHDGICYEDMTNNPDMAGILVAGEMERQRCIGGSWNLGTIKSSPDGSQSGYCGNPSECFYSNIPIPRSDGVTSSCIASDTSRNDNYCYEGNWTSRTAVLSKTILKGVDIEAEDYTLFCDSHENALNYLGTTPDGANVAELLAGLDTNGGRICGTKDCVNNFCVLNKDGEISFGTSLNFNISNRTTGLGAVFEQLNCTGVANDYGYIGCSSPVQGGTWTYYPGSSIILFKETAGFFGTITDIMNGVIDFLKNIFTGGQNSQVDGVFKEATQFNRAYSSRIGDTSVEGFVEKVFFDGSEVDAMYIKYTSAEELQVCKIVNEIKVSKGLTNDALECVKNEESTGENSYIVTSKNAEINELWIDLTAKLRVEED